MNATVRDRVMPRDQHRLESPFTRTVPFDYVVRLRLEGVRDRLAQSTINISTVGPFVVTGIGYGLNPDPSDCFSGATAPEDEIQVAPPPVVAPTANGLRVFGTPGSLLRVFAADNPKVFREVELKRDFADIDALDLDEGVRTLVVVDVRTGSTSNAIVKSGGASAPPKIAPRFAPRRPQLGNTEFDVVGAPGSELDITVLRNGIEPRLRLLPITVPDKDENGRIAGRVKVPLNEPRDGPIPVERTRPMGQRKVKELRKLADELGIDSSLAKPELADAICTTLAAQIRALRRDDTDDAPSRDIGLEPGDLIIVRDRGTGFTTTLSLPSNPLDIPLRSLPRFALRDGFRLDAEILRNLESGVPLGSDAITCAFEALNRVTETLEFLYSITDNGTGRALQSEPVHNIAGLGIANGDRPFRTFPRPIVLAPRSVLLFQVKEISGGPGDLYFVLHGYKVVGASPSRLPGIE